MSPLETGPLEGPSFACSLAKALGYIKPAVNKGIRDKWTTVIFAKHGILPSPHDVSLKALVLNHPLAMKELQQKLRVALLVIKTHQVHGKTRKRHQLLYDGRHAVVDHLSSAPLKVLWLAQDDRVHLCTDRLDVLPLLSQNSYRRKQWLAQKPLWEILGVPPDHVDIASWPSPSHLEALRDYLQHFRQPHTKVVVTFATGLLHKSLVCDWIQDPPTPTPAHDLARVIHVMAFTDRHYHLAFAEKEEIHLERDQRRGKKIQADFERYRAQWEKQKERERDQGSAKAHQANCAAAVHVMHSGLGLAYDLGLISATELERLSYELGQTYSSLYVFLDNKHHLRHITYFDVKATFCREVTCFEHDSADFNVTMSRSRQRQEDSRRQEAVQVMMAFWQQVYDRRLYWMQQRHLLLSPLVDRLKGLLSTVGASRSIQPRASKTVTSPLSRCLRELVAIISRHRIYLYSKEDSHLHAMKYYLTHFAYQRVKRCRGLYIKASSDDTLMKMSIPGLVVLNLHAYLSCKKDLDFFASLQTPWKGPHPSDVLVVHSQKQLAHQPKVRLTDTETMTLSAYCRQYGWMYARHLFRYWANFGQFILSTFGYEMHGQTSPPSASYLAFQCVWTQYVKRAGPMAQSLERCKPYYEDWLRECSKGGFMFSIGDGVDQGQPLHESATTEDPNHLACSIAEYDLVSAYGYGAAQSYMPSGFGVGYQCDQVHPWLDRLDPKMRHKSFEFRAVYKTIDKLMRRQGMAIRSVYHNYSPLGLFTLGKYNLDLMVVAEDGKMLLVNMDGRWIHGCDVCPPDGPFAFGQTHAQVRSKTRQRDEDIQAWVKALNSQSQAQGGPPDWVEYIVIHDCHSSGFTLACLERAFTTEPTLLNLVRGYRMVERFGPELTMERFQEALAEQGDDPNFTFILKAYVSVEPEAGLCLDADQDGSLTLGPLVIYKDNDSSTLTDDPSDANYFTLDRRSKRNVTHQRLAWEGRVVLTRDYYQWLERTFGQRFHVHEMDWILFYKTEPILNTIYRQLVDLRSTTDDPILISFIKKLVNLSAGFYGSRSTLLNNKTTYRLVNKTPWNYVFFRHTMEMQHAMDLGDDSYCLLETKPWPKAETERTSSKSAVPLFLTIVEYGKLRLVQLLHFLQQHLYRHQFRLLYSNIDNLILALGHGARCLEEAVQPQQRASFELHGPHFFVCPTRDDDKDEKAPGGGSKRPGLAELQWTRQSPGWTFKTLRTQHYCLGTPHDPGQSLHKTSGWSNVTSEQAIEWTQQLMQGQSVAIPQTRRTHKKLNMDTKDIVLYY